MDIKETRAFAETIAASISENRRIFALHGDLGAGKTAFSGFFLRALGVKESVLSPTFVIMKRYPLPSASHPFTSAYHIDCYRLSRAEELDVLGFREAVADPKNIMLIEWADRVRNAIPEGAVWIRFSHGANEGERDITEAAGS